VSYQIWTQSGIHSFTSTSQTYRMRQRSVEGSLSFLASPRCLITLGVRTHTFLYQADFGVIPPVAFEHDAFKKIQPFASVSFAPVEILSAYISLMPQSNRVYLSGGVFRLTGLDFVLTGESVTYPAELRYGVEVGVGGGIELSMEMRHPFVVDDNPGAPVVDLQLGVGAKIHLADNIFIGMRYSRYLEYDPRHSFSVSNSMGFLESWKAADPYTLALTGRVNVGLLTVQPEYQYSHSSFLSHGQPAMIESSHFVSLLASYTIGL
jgi:hypothetical protein